MKSMDLDKERKPLSEIPVIIGKLKEQQEILLDSIISLAVIPEGYFLMGNDNRLDNECPKHRVWIDSFAIGRYTITNGQYSLFINDTSWQFPPGWDDKRFNHPDQPVTS